MTVYEENILIFDSRFPALAQRLETMEEEDAPFRVVQAKNEAYTAKIISEKKSDTVCQRRDPLPSGR